MMREDRVKRYDDCWGVILNHNGVWPSSVFRWIGGGIAKNLPPGIFFFRRQPRRHDSEDGTKPDPMLQQEHGLAKPNENEDDDDDEVLLFDCCSSSLLDSFFLIVDLVT